MTIQRKLTLSLCMIVTFLGAGCESNKQTGNNKSLNAGYAQVIDSFRGGSMLFSCGLGDTTFKISSGIFGSPKLYWKNGIEWIELDDVSFKDTGVVFTGLGKRDGVPLNNLTSSISIPIFNSDSAYDKNRPIDYFKKVKSMTFVPYRYTVDMLREKMRSTNMEEIVDYIELDEEKYRKEQSIIPYSYLFSFNNTQRRDEDEKKKRRKEQVDVVVKKFSSPVRITTPAFTYEEEDYCSRID